MKSTSIWDYGTIVGKFMIGLVFAALIFSVDAVPALARDGYPGGYDNRHYDHGRPGYDRDRYDHGRPGYDRYRYDHRRPMYEHGRPVYRPYGYRGRGYGPPVVYTPPPPPGIGIFFPPIIIHP